MNDALLMIAYAELRSLLRFSDGLIELRRLIDEGTPLLRANIDRLAAGETGNIIVRYEVCEPLKVFLAAMRARNGQPNKIESGHGDPPVKGGYHIPRAKIGIARV
jgi:hypothetical protein